MTCRADADSVLLLFTGEQGPTVVDLVKKNPAVALGVVLPRLLQKDEEWCAAHCPATTFAEHDSLHKNVARCLISYGSHTEIHVSYAPPLPCVLHSSRQSYPVQVSNLLNSFHMRPNWRRGYVCLHECCQRKRETDG